MHIGLKKLFNQFQIGLFQWYLCKNVLFEDYNFCLVNLQATWVVSSGQSGELLALFIPVEYIPAIPLNSTYVIVNGLGWFQGKEHSQNITPFFLSAQGKLNKRVSKSGY